MEGRVQLLEKGLFYLSCCHKLGDLNVTGEGESIKLGADGVSWSWENEGNVTTLK